MQSDSISSRCHHSFVHNSRSNSSSSRSSDWLPIKLPICAIRDNSGRIFGKYRARCAPVMDTAGVTLYSVLGSKLQVETCVQARTQVDLFAWYVHVLWRWSDQDDSDAIWLQIFWRFFSYESDEAPGGLLWASCWRLHKINWMLLASRRPLWGSA